MRQTLSATTIVNKKKLGYENEVGDDASHLRKIIPDRRKFVCQEDSLTECGK
jgi:hypothetical protein